MGTAHVCNERGVVTASKRPREYASFDALGLSMDAAHSLQRRLLLVQTRMWEFKQRFFRRSQWTNTYAATRYSHLAVEAAVLRKRLKPFSFLDPTDQMKGWENTILIDRATNRPLTQDQLVFSGGHESDDDDADSEYEFVEEEDALDDFVRL